MAQTKPSYTIEPVKEQEIPTVMEINRECLPENYPRHYFMYLFQSYPRSFLVAKIDQTIIGYIMCKVQPSRFTNKIPFLKRGPIGHIVSVAVKEPYRNMGIGEQLVKKGLAATTLTHKTKEYMLEVRVSNKAVNFYKRLGFKIERVLHRYYNDGEDGYLMVRKAFEDIDAILRG
ncbi:MAG: GNAT family N-acetyltransferase [Candidatus Ranarchaeia archaeon]